MDVLAFFFFNDTATTEIYTLSLHDALPISRAGLDVDQVARLANAAILGDVASFVLKGDRPVNIRVRAEADHADDASRLSKLLLKAPSGTLLTLDQLGSLQYEGGQTQIRREDLR